MNLTSGYRLIDAYVRARRLDRISDRGRLEMRQHRWLARMMGYVTQRSRHYREFIREPFTNWPQMDKLEWMARFDDINTVGARLDEVMTIALRAERTRDFTPTWRGLTVGLSTGTSGSRGLFLVGPDERARWAGTLLGKLLRAGLFARERIALVLRAGSTLYEPIAALRRRFEFFDQAQPWAATATALSTFRPTILVAPARALRLLADTVTTLRPARVISVAEVLDELDRARIEAAFGVPVEQIYQATEGLLGVSCEHGTVHLNEPYLLIERHWLDAGHTRFVPIVTDLMRRVQPVIRYRLNDVLRVAPDPCRCGRAALAVAAIEGRLDDLLWLDGLWPDGQRESVAIFPDLLTRAIVGSTPVLEDYKVVETARGRWRIELRPFPPLVTRQRLIEDCRAVAVRLGATPPEIDVRPLAEPAGPAAMSAAPAPGKQRRVRRMEQPACVS